MAQWLLEEAAAIALARERDQLEPDEGPAQARTQHEQIMAAARQGRVIASR